MQPTKKKRITKPRVAGMAALALILLFTALISFQPFEGIPCWRDIFRFFQVSEKMDEAEDYDLAVHFIDVGKADSIFLTCKGKNILIDAGDVDLSARTTEYLKRRGVTTLDLVIATHPDKDHIGGMANVLLEFEVGRFMMPRIPEEALPNSTSYQMMLYALQSEDIPVTDPAPGQTFSIGELELQVLGPQKIYENTNNNSVILRISYKEDSFLFMGDAEEEAEKDLLQAGYDLQSEVLKVGHHGSKSSTSQELLDAVQPRFAVISVGEDGNKLPKASVLKRLEVAETGIYRTDQNGTVVAATNGQGITWITEQ
ncbi:MAG: MBL fold metallo-hydrolase [Clostridiales bacterium]|jgi:competence protein ComEC|nr:MBL fold metallo-hydrolase [Clostridiales bacterium]